MSKKSLVSGKKYLPLSMEKWEPIKINTNYEVSSYGRVRSIDRIDHVLANGKYPCKKILKGKILSNRIWKNRNKVSLSGVGHYVHRLVALAFIPNPKEYPMINHIDGNPLNNHISNLEWCDNSHNQKHAYEIGLKNPKRGEKSHFAKLTQDQVYEIKRLRNDGMKTIELARIYSINQRTISAICNNKIWKHL